MLNEHKVCVFVREEGDEFRGVTNNNISIHMYFEDMFCNLIFFACMNFFFDP